MKKIIFVYKFSVNKFLKSLLLHCIHFTELRTQFSNYQSECKDTDFSKLSTNCTVTNSRNCITPLSLANKCDKSVSQNRSNTHKHVCLIASNCA